MDQMGQAEVLLAVEIGRGQIREQWFLNASLGLDAGIPAGWRGFLGTQIPRPSLQCAPRNKRKDPSPGSSLWTHRQGLSVRRGRWGRGGHSSQRDLRRPADELGFVWLSHASPFALSALSQASPPLSSLNVRPSGILISPPLVISE